MRVEVLVAHPRGPSSPLTWSLGWERTPAASQMLVTLLSWRVSLITPPATVADNKPSVGDLVQFESVVGR